MREDPVTIQTDFRPDWTHNTALPIEGSSTMHRDGLVVGRVHPLGTITLFLFIAVSACANVLDVEWKDYDDSQGLPTPLDLGFACSVDSDCASSFCRDGVCCDTNCGGLCVACSGLLQAGGVGGHCRPISKGFDPENECLDQQCSFGLCDGNGACESEPCSTTTTTTATTSASTSTSSGPNCDDTGVCGDSTTGCILCALAGNCADEYDACAADQGCIEFSDCAGACADQACYDLCSTAYPTGADIYNALVACVVCDECYIDCDGAGSGCP